MVITFIFRYNSTTEQDLIISQSCQRRRKSLELVILLYELLKVRPLGICVETACLVVES